MQAVQHVHIFTDEQYDRSCSAIVESSDKQKVSKKEKEPLHSPPAIGIVVLACTRR